MPRLRLVFMGTPELAATCLSALLAAPDVEVIAVVSQPDKPRGRHLRLAPTPVKDRALAGGIPVLQPDKARDPDFLNQLRQLAPDLIVVAAYGQMLPVALLEIPRHGCVNVHTSLLPRYRGAAPIQWAILNGDAGTGVTIMRIVPELDAGDILSQETTPIADDDDAQTLHDRLARLGADLLVRTLPDYIAGRVKSVPQPADGVVYARKIRKEDGLVDWTRTASEICNQVRGLVPWPGAFTHLPGVPSSWSGSGRQSAQSGPGRATLLKLWKAKLEKSHGIPGQILRADEDGIVVGCGSGALSILELQREGGRRMTAVEFLAGHTLRAGNSLEAGPMTPTGAGGA
jgi:methionyl-tRNA formyltransferase